MDFIEKRKIGSIEPVNQDFVLYLPDSAYQDIDEQSELLTNDCLPSHSKRKREIKGECLFTWEDVEEFNKERNMKREFSKIEIDGQKFINYIKDLSEQKRSQLILLADQVKVYSDSQHLVDKLIGDQRIAHHLNRVGKISGITMHGMMGKNVIADFLNGNSKGVAINIGFIAGGQGFAKIAEAASIKGLKLSSEGKLLLGTSLKAASSFLARGTSAFVIYDLVNQVKAFKNGTEEALIGIIGDSIYLSVDTVEISIEVAEAFEVLEGVSTITGPIGAAIGAVVFVGTDIYMAVKKVNQIDHIIRLRGKERFMEGLRAFIGLQPEEHLEALMEEKQLYNQLVKHGFEYLQQHNDIQRYVFPTGMSAVDSCETIPSSVRICISGGFNGCPRTHTIIRETKKCSTKFEEDLDNIVLLDEKRADIKWSRAKPDNPKGGQLFCSPEGNDQPAPSYWTYLCKNAIGITDLSTNKTGDYTLINLGRGTDYAKGFIESPNIFVVNNGSNKYFGGNKDDVFVVQGNSVKGYLYGGGGINTLDLTSFASEEESIDVKFHIGQVEDNFRDNYFGISGINKFLGRKNKADQVFVGCDSTNNIKFIDAQGGTIEFDDHLNIYDKDCNYEIQIIVRPNTAIHNRALEGNFHYTIPYGLGSAKVDFIYSKDRLNLNNTFTFEYEPDDIDNIAVRNLNILNKTLHTINFSFSPKSNKEFNLTISGAINPSYRLGNHTEIKVGNKGNFYMLQNSNKSVDEIIKKYLVLANRLRKMSFFIQSLLNNETVVIGSGNHEIIHNNPLHNSHLIGNGGENVYIIDFEIKNVNFNQLPLPEVIIYDFDTETSIDTIDLRNLIQKTKSKFPHFELEVFTSKHDLLLKATVKKPVRDSIRSIRKQDYFNVRLKEGMNWYNKVHIVKVTAPMKINLEHNEWSLKPLPLKFEKDKKIILVTSQDVEENTELIAPRTAENFKVVRDNDNNLLITNAFNANISQGDLCTIILSKFYEEPIMRTLSVKFADEKLILKDMKHEINTARDVNIVKREYTKQVYSDVFNRTKKGSEPNENRYQSNGPSQKTRNRRNINVTSSGIRVSSWINNLFSWAKSSIDQLVTSKPEGISTTNLSTAQTDIAIDVNGTILLLDVLTRKVTGQKYNNSRVDWFIAHLEAQSYAINITELFEKVIKQAARQSKIPMHQLNIDFIKVQEEIARKFVSGELIKISQILKAQVEKACIIKGENCLGMINMKKFNRFIKEFNKRLENLNESI